MSFGFFKNKNENLIQEKMKPVIDVIDDYCSWYNERTKEFIISLEKNNFSVSWGFEVEDFDNISKSRKLPKIYIPNSDYYIIDFPKTKGFICDEDSKQFLYFDIDYGTFENYFLKQPHNNPYKYVLIPFEKVNNVTLEVDSTQLFSTKTHSKNVLSRSVVGGILAGAPGAIIGGMTSNKESTTIQKCKPQIIKLKIDTSLPEIQNISFSFKPSLYRPNGDVSDLAIIDSLFYTFSKENFENNKFVFHMPHRSVFLDTSLKNEKPASMFMKNHTDIFGLHAVLESILKIVKEYSSKIDDIIQSNCISNQQHKDTIDDIELLKKLSELKNSGILTEEEFNAKKAEILSKIS